MSGIQTVGIWNYTDALLLTLYIILVIFSGLRNLNSGAKSLQIGKTNGDII